MNNEEFLQRLLELAEKQQGNIENLQNIVENQNKNISNLEQIVQAQQRTIDTLTAMAQPVYNVNIDAHGDTITTGNINGGNNNIGSGEHTICDKIGVKAGGAQVQNFNTKE